MLSSSGYFLGAVGVEVCLVSVDVSEHLPVCLIKTVLWRRGWGSASCQEYSYKMVQVVSSPGGDVNLMVEFR